MSKRSSFKRRPQDAYLTFDQRAGDALAPHLAWGVTFWEPCAGAGDLIRNIQRFGPSCVCATDTHPQAEGIYRSDALAASADDFASTGATHIITNPPWTRKILHQMIEHFAALAPTWLLFDAGWVHTQQARPFLSKLVSIVSVGRLIWIEETSMTGKDDVAWHLFDARHTGPTTFHGRAG